MREMTVKASGLRTGDTVLRRLPAVSYVIVRVVSDGSDGGDVLVLTAANQAHYYDPGEQVKIRRQ